MLIKLVDHRDDEWARREVRRLYRSRSDGSVANTYLLRQRLRQRMEFVKIILDQYIYNETYLSEQKRNAY